MQAHRHLALAASLLGALSCGQYRNIPAGDVSAADVASSHRWHAALNRAAGSEGASQLDGWAALAPDSVTGATAAFLSVFDAEPGSVHTWEVRRGRCGADEGAFGPIEAYKPIAAGSDGRATVLTTVPLRTPTTGSYFVNVHGSGGDPTVVACGEFTLPAE